MYKDRKAYKGPQPKDIPPPVIPTLADARTLFLADAAVTTILVCATLLAFDAALRFFQGDPLTLTGFLEMLLL